MAYLIGQLLVPLAIAAVFGGGLAGWSWHSIRTRDKWAARDAERDRLRDELLTYVGYVGPERDGPILLGNTELEAVQLRLDAANEHVLSLQRQLAAQEEACGDHESRIAQLEMELASSRAGDDGAERFAVMETALRDAESKAGDLERRARELEGLLDNAAAQTNGGVDVAALSWRVRQLESELAQRDAEANIARIADAAPPPAPAPVDDEGLVRERWKARYLQARVNYLEDQARSAPPMTPPAPPMPAADVPPIDEEAENRKRWRQRYLEARVAWLEGRARDGVQMRERLAGELNARDQRMRALEAKLAETPPEDPRVQQLAQHAAELEGALAAARADGAHAARRVAELEANHARLEAHIAELESRPPPEPVREPDPEAGSLRWRSRYLDSRVRFLEQTIANTPRGAPAPAPAAPRDDKFAPLQPAGAEVRPAGMPAPRDGARDDLRMIAGIDPRVESTLNSLGVYHFDQIAAWTPANIDWVERYLAFKGRIGREDWVRQADALARGEMTDGKRRYLEGEPV